MRYTGSIKGSPKIGLINANPFPISSAKMVGLDFAVNGIRMGAHQYVDLPLVLYSFYNEEHFLRHVQIKYKRDLCSLLALSYIQLPFRMEVLKERIEEALLKPKLEPSEIRKRTTALRESEILDAIDDFDHDCRGRASKGIDGWKYVRAVLFPELCQRIKRWDDAGDRPILQEIRRIVNKVEPSFQELLNFIQEAKLMKVSKENANRALEKVVEGWRARIMILEDMKREAVDLKEIVESFGHTVVMETDVEVDPEFLVKDLETTKIEVILFDFKFGTFEKGKELLRAVRERCPRLKILVVSGYGGENISEARRLGAHDYLMKLVNPAILASKIRGLITRKRIVAVDDDISSVITEEFRSMCIRNRWEVHT